MKFRAFISRIWTGTKVLFPSLTLRALMRSGAGISSYTPSNERLLLYEEAGSSLKLERFLEIGSHLGASAVVLAEVLRRRGGKKDRRVFCIDTWRNDAMSAGPRETKADFDRNTAPWAGFIEAIRGDSRTLPLPFTGECDLVFIDGDHSYEATRADALRFAPFVRPGGRLLLHDHDRVSVAKVVGELLATGEWTVARCVGRLLSLRREEQG